MKQIVPFLFAMTLTISSGPTTTEKVYWAIFGPIEVTTMTATVPDMPETSVIPPINTDVILKAYSGDCHKLIVSPNGTLGTEWVACP